MVVAKASGKIILFGEHAVVYGKPGIAIPVNEVFIKANVTSGETFSYSTDKELYKEEKERLSKLIDIIFLSLKLEKRDLSIDIWSTIPLSSGLGSSAALSVSIIKALSLFFDLGLHLSEINKLAFRCEKIFHGNPSGLDNTVVAYGQPVFFKEEKIEFIKIKKPMSFIIANSGKRPSTSEIVAEVRERYEKDNYSILFDEIGEITEKAKAAIETGNLGLLAQLMNNNHECLKKMEVSTEKIDLMCETAIEKGALGAKLSGAGKGGNIIILAEKENIEKIIKSLKKYSENIITTTLK